MCRETSAASTSSLSSITDVQKCVKKNKSRRRSFAAPRYLYTYIYTDEWQYCWKLVKFFLVICALSIADEKSRVCVFATGKPVIACASNISRSGPLDSFTIDNNHLQSVRAVWREKKESQVSETWYIYDWSWGVCWVEMMWQDVAAIPLCVCVCWKTLLFSTSILTARKSIH